MSYFKQILTVVIVFAITSPARGTLPYAPINPAASYCGGSPIARCRIR